jgi:hypothetical protein
MNVPLSSRALSASHPAPKTTKSIQSPKFGI